ncbi:uncharacterized protein LOC134215870 [Armigeres subalbatus]|uniref:uncharacterized protein LOC134215870 n=1 Tax=Armigeres subalbatus TaxID=124917 RepID=UPI002ED3B655
MEIRWCWIAYILLIVITHKAGTHNTQPTDDSGSTGSASDNSANNSRTESSSLNSSISSSDSDSNSNSNKSSHPVINNVKVEERYAEPYQQPLAKSSLKDTANKLKQDIESNYNLDEIIASTETTATKSLKKYLLKENKKYRKKYVSNDDYRQPSASEREPRESPLAEDDAATTSTKTTRKLIDESEKPHSRKKRLIWITDDGRLALPPGTSLTIAPTIAMPFVRYPPTGFLSNISISLPVTIDFDKLGLTDNQNPLGVLPPLLARSMGRAAGSILADYVSDYMHTRRRKRSAANVHGNENFKITSNFIDEEDNQRKAPELPEEHKHAFHGGERALLYTVVEDFIANFGLDGKACMLRAICEIHSKPVERFGLIGEVLKLFFTASLSPYSEHLDEYVSAENIGKGESGPGECFPYYKDCPKSLFRMGNNFQHRYNDESVHGSTQDDLYDNEIDDIEREIPKDETMIHLERGVNKVAM